MVLYDGNITTRGKYKRKGVSLMKYEAIVCDLDGTLLNEKHKLSDETKEVIGKVKATGRKIFIATGRHHLDALEIKKQLGLDSYLISSNGARIHDENNIEVYERNIDDETAKFILDTEVSSEVARHIYTDTKWYVEEDKSEYLEFHKESGFLHEVKDFEKIKNEKWIKIFFISKNQEELLRLERYFEKEIGKKISITLSGPECLELMAKDVTKGEAIKNIMSKLNIPLENTMAFGDGLNDYEMLSEVGKGLLMGNCAVRLREKLPNNEMIGKNTENGVANYLRKKFL